MGMSESNVVTVRGLRRRYGDRTVVEGRSPAMNTAVGRLVRTELTLMTREPLTVIFVFVFPVVTMPIIGGSFGTRPTGLSTGSTRRTGTWRPTTRS